MIDQRKALLIRFKISLKTCGAFQRNMRLEEQRLIKQARSSYFAPLFDDNDATLEADVRATRIGHLEEVLTSRKGLYHARTVEGRRGTRASHLAYGFLRGRPYRMMEQISYTAPDWRAVTADILRYSGEDPRVVMQRFAQWLSEGGQSGEVKVKAA